MSPGTLASCCCGGGPPTCMLEQEPTYGDPNWQEITCPYPVCDYYWDHPENVMYTRYDSELLIADGYFDDSVNYSDMDVWSPYLEGAGFIPNFGAGDNGTVVWLPREMWAPLIDPGRTYKLRGRVDSTTYPNHPYDFIGNRWGADSAGVWHYPNPGSAVRMHGCKLHEQEVFVGGQTHAIEWFMYYFSLVWADCMCTQLPGQAVPPDTPNCPGAEYQKCLAFSSGGVAWAALYKNSSVVFGQNGTTYPERDEQTEAQAFVHIAFGGNQDEMISHSYHTPFLTPSGQYIYNTVPYYSGPLSLVDRGWHWTEEYPVGDFDIHHAGPQHKVGWRMLFPWPEPYPE